MLQITRKNHQSVFQMRYKYYLKESCNLSHFLERLGYSHNFLRQKKSSTESLDFFNVIMRKKGGVEKMREQLEEINEYRGTFTGEFVRLGKKRSYGYLKETVLLIDVKDEAGKKMTDHLWFNLTKGFQNLNLKEGDLVQFDARVKEYQKGYKGRRRQVYKPVENDYKLSHPTKLSVINSRK